jgi:predicted RNA-binding Zn-ribbon protein involved in translation (DUF1610 family)
MMETVEYNAALPEEEKLRLQKEANKYASWYPGYAPYCVQTHVKCNSPRMIAKAYGFRCPNCGNMIGHNGVRLQESPLNKRTEGQLLKTRVDIGVALNAQSLLITLNKKK